MIASLRRMALVCGIAGMSLAGFAGADEPPAVQRGTGRIVDLTPTRITIQLKGDGGERMLELTLNDRTKVVSASNEVVRVVTGRGDVQELRKAVDRKVADLKVEHWVNVLYADGIAVQVFSSTIGQEGVGDGRGGERPRDGDRPRDGAREADRPRGEVRRDGDLPRVEGVREGGDRPAVRRDGDVPREGVREGDRPAVREGGDRPPEVRRDGDVPRPEPRRDGDRPRDGDVPREARPDGDGRSANAASLVVGDIASVEGGKLTVNLTRRNDRTGATSVVTIDPATEIRIEGNPGRSADLRPGMPVSVTVEKGVAVRVEVPIDLSKPRSE